MGWWTGRAPGLSGVSDPGARGVKRSFEPGIDIQFGRHFETRGEREAYAKRRGLVGLSSEEYNREKNSSPSPSPDWSGLKDVMKDAYEEVAAGKGPSHLVTDLQNNVIVEENHGRSA